MVATEGDEVQAALVLVSDRFDAHSPGLWSDARPTLPQKRGKGGVTPFWELAKGVSQPPTDSVGLEF